METKPDRRRSVDNITIDEAGSGGFLEKGRGDAVRQNIALTSAMRLVAGVSLWTMEWFQERYLKPFDEWQYCRVFWD